MSGLPRLRLGRLCAALMVTGLSVLSALGSLPALAQKKAETPYLDALKKRLSDEDAKNGAAEEQPRPGAPDPYIQSLKKKTPKADDSRGYTEALKKSLPKEKEEEKGEKESFTEKKKKELPPEPGESPIQKVKEGRSTELEAKYQGNIHQAAGFQVGTFLSRSITASAEVSDRPFTTVYGEGFRPDFKAFYEFQPWHSEWYGNIGIFASLGFTYFGGTGSFKVPLKNPKTGADFEPQTKFKFFLIPVTAGLNYRFNLLRYLRPYVQAGPTLIGFIESRSDDSPSIKGRSTGFSTSVGVNIFLNPIFGEASWSLYETSNVKKYYFTVDYTRLTPIAGKVRFEISGISLGFTYEF